jgi:hypothetical protein
MVHARSQLICRLSCTCRCLHSSRICHAEPPLRACKCLSRAPQLGVSGAPRRALEASILGSIRDQLWAATFSCGTRRCDERVTGVHDILRCISSKLIRFKMPPTPVWLARGHLQPQPSAERGRQFLTLSKYLAEEVTSIESPYFHFCSFPPPKQQTEHHYPQQ